MLLKVEYLFRVDVFHVAKIPINAISTLQNMYIFSGRKYKKTMFDSSFSSILSTFVLFLSFLVL